MTAYRLAEIADHLSIHPDTVSRRLKQAEQADLLVRIADSIWFFSASLRPPWRAYQAVGGLDRSAEGERTYTYVTVDRLPST